MKFLIPLRSYDTAFDIPFNRWPLVHTEIYGPFGDDEAIKKGVARLKARGERAKKFLVLEGQIIDVETEQFEMPKHRIDLGGT